MGGGRSQEEAGRAGGLPRSGSHTSTSSLRCCLELVPENSKRLLCFSKPKCCCCFSKATVLDDLMRPLSTLGLKGDDSELPVTLTNGQFVTIFLVASVKPPLYAAKSRWEGSAPRDLQGC